MFPKKPWIRWALGAFFFGFAVGGLFYLKSRLDKRGDAASEKITLEGDGAKVVTYEGVEYRETNWKELVQLDYRSGERSPVLRAVENRMVRIPGYIVPLTDDVAVLDEFLFVPNDQACIHVPPPPPNLIVKAKLRQKLPFEDVYNPSWLYGKLEIVETKSQFGDAAYQINNAELVKYEETR